MSTIPAPVVRQTSSEAWGSSAPINVEAPALSQAQWMTPGRAIADAIAHRTEVRLVVERLETDRYAVFVILDSDPEDLLDAIVDAERRVLLRPRGLPFDLRIMKPAPDWSDADLKRGSLVLFEPLTRHVRD